MTPHWLESFDWQTGLEILSLDFIEPVYYDLGVQIRDRLTLKRLSRDALTGVLTGHPHNSPFPEGEDFYSAHLVPFLEWTGGALGRSGRKRLEFWVAYTVSTGIHNPWTFYEGIISTWAAIYRKTNRDEIGFATDPERIAGEVKVAGDLSAAEAVLQKQRRSALTDWDLSVFTKLGLLDVPKGSDFFPLVDAIELTITMHRFHTFWSWLLSFIGPKDLDAIASYAKDKAAQNKVHYVPPGDLPVLEA
jgi:hypothetical protein